MLAEASDLPGYIVWAPLTVTVGASATPRTWTANEVELVAALKSGGTPEQARQAAGIADIAVPVPEAEIAG